MVKKNVDWGVQMDWLQVITIVLSLAGFLAGLLYWFRMDLKADISRLDSDVKDMRNEIKADMRAQTARTDKLYEMFIDMQAKTDAKFTDIQTKMDARFREADQKFYDLLDRQNKTKTDP